MFIQITVVLQILVASVVSELSHLDADHQSCGNSCDKDEVCRSYYLRWNGDFLLCPSTNAFKCHPAPRPCTPAETAKYCSADRPYCTFEHYHHCVDFDKAVNSNGDYVCTVAEQPCKSVGYIPSSKYCEVKNDRKFVDRMGVIEQRAVVSNKNRKCGNGGLFCKKSMSCWSTLSLVLADGLLNYYTETCAFKKDPCQFKDCPGGKVCAITTKFIRKSPDLCTKEYGSLCSAVTQVQEIAVCQNE